MINDKYQEIIKKCKFIAKPDTWFVDGTEATCSGNFSLYKSGDKFGNGWSLFEGMTDESFSGYSGELPRLDGESCHFDEFLIYDEFGNEISELSLEEYIGLLNL